MCTQAHVLFVCNHNKPFGPAKRCEWARMKEIDCPDAMTGVDYDASKVIPFNCLECVMKNGDEEKKGKLERLLSKVLGK